MSSTTEQSTLLQAPDATRSPEAPVIVQVAKRFGVSPLRQLRETMMLRYGAPKLAASDYYAFGLFDPDMPMEVKRHFVGTRANNQLNAALTPPALAPTRAFVGNKLLYTQLLGKIGISTAETQALVSTFREVGALPVLRDAQMIVDFLRDRAKFPVFGKPLHGSLSDGSVRIAGREGDRLHLGNGKTQDLASFAEEVMARYKAGYLLQDALDPHPDMAAIAGPAMGCVRIVTVHDGFDPKPAYAVWKLPAPMAMSDNFWQSGSLLAHVELDTGQVLTCKRGTGPGAERLVNHPESHAPVVGATLPFWAETRAIARAAHAVFPEFGVAGFDIAVTPDGPQILECNDNPNHGLFQFAADTGIWDPTLAPLWQAVMSRQKAQAARHKAAAKSR